jgi:hypothetical protein
MDNDLKALLESQFEKVNRRIDENTNIMLREHEATRQQVVENSNKIRILSDGQKQSRVQLEELWKTVNGSMPPPGAPGSQSSGSNGDAPIQKKLSLHDGELDTLEGRLISVDGRVGQVMEEVKAVKAQNARQLEVMGEGREKGLMALLTWMFKEREGQKFMASVFAGLTGLVTAIGTTYAILTGRLPLPYSPPPPSHVEEASQASPGASPNAGAPPLHGLEADGGVAPEAVRN